LIEQHLSILLVVIPLLAAPITAILPRARLAWLLTLLVSWVCLLLAVWQLQIVLTGNIISYELGGWAPPWGIEYRIDTINAFIAMIVAAIAAVTLPYALRSVEQEIVTRRIPLFYTAFLLCLTGLLGITLTGDIFNLFVFLEISSLSSYALISMGRQRQALTAAFQYLVMGTIGATFLLIGIGLIYAETGTLNMLDLAARLPSVFEHRTVHTAFAFIMIGVALKLAMFPLHLWLPNAYTYAPTVITIFLAATATKVAIYVMLRMVYTVFSIGFAEDTPLNEMFMLLGVFGVLIASVYAIYQNNSKRLLAYSSVAQIGYMVLGIGFGSVLGLTATIVHIFNHALMKAALFMAVGALIYRVGSSYLRDWNGLGRQMPWTFAALVIAGLSLIGLPGTAGFISKWYLVSAAVEQHNWSIAFIILLGSLLAVVYVWKMVEVLFFREPDTTTPVVREAPLLLLVPTWFVVLANLYFGFNTELTVDIARGAATMLENMSP
jgi:multicomponent Na+:H+ antiporter subunit D